jgi:hypothetical protein
MFWIFRIGDLFVSEFVSVRGAAFDIRISDFDSLASWREKIPNRKRVISRKGAKVRTNN